MATKYSPFCEVNGVAHSTLTTQWCPECGSRSKPTYDTVKNEIAAPHTASSRAFTTLTSTPTPSRRLSVREGTVDRPIALEDSPGPVRAGVLVPISQTQPLSKIQLAPGAREAEHAHMMNEVAIAKRKSISARGNRTSKPNRLLSSLKEIHGTLLKIDLKILIVHYFLYIGSDTPVFIEAEKKRQCTYFYE
jgi:hypothetical protein